MLGFSGDSVDRKEYQNNFERCGGDFMCAILDVFRDNEVDVIGLQQMVDELPSAPHYPICKGDVRVYLEHVIEYEGLMGGFGVRFDVEKKQFLWIEK